MDIDYQQLAEEHAEIAASCVAKEFVRAEPLTTALELSYEQYFPVAHAICKKVIGEGLSFGAFDKQSKILIACVIACDFTTPPPSNLVEQYPVVAPVYAILGELDEYYFNNFDVSPGQSAHVLFAAVSNDYSGKGIYQNLRQRVHQNAKIKGFSYVLGEVTGEASQTVTTKRFRNEVLKEIAYSDFQYQKKKYFSSIKTPANCKLVRGVLR